MSPVVQVEARFSGRNVAFQVLEGIDVSALSQHDLLVGSVNGQLNVVDRAALHLAKGINNGLVDGEGNTVDISTTTDIDCASCLISKVNPCSLYSSTRVL